MNTQEELNRDWGTGPIHSVDMPTFNRFTSDGDPDGLTRVRVVDEFGQTHEALCMVEGRRVYYRMRGCEWDLWS
jgi:hypothetical protein